MLKDPGAVLPFTVDWTPWLAGEGDTAASVTWVVPDGITQAEPPPALDGGKATIWLSGGTVGQRYAIVCRITTAGGRVDERTIHVRVEQR